MRGKQSHTGPMFFAFDVEDRIRPDHPLRAIRREVDAVLAELSPLLDRCYSDTGRPGVPPEVLLKALLLQCLYSIRSERQLVERLDTDLLFRWFCGLDPAEPLFDATGFTHNRPRLDHHRVTAAFFDAVRQRAIDAGLADGEHFSVDGTLIQSHASPKSFVPVEDRACEADARDDERDRPSGVPGVRRSNATHASTTDPEARLYKKSDGHEARLAHMAHAISENRHGLVMAVHMSEAGGRAERQAALCMLDDLRAASITPRTLGADKGYDSGPWMIELESRGVVPHAALRRMPVGGAKGSGLRGSRRTRTAARLRMLERTATPAYRASQRARKKIEEAFAWCKTIAGLSRARHVGRWKIRQQLELAAAAYNLVRMRTLRQA
jgi:transposase